MNNINGSERYEPYGYIGVCSTYKKIGRDYK